MAALHSDELFNKHIDWMAEVLQIYEESMVLDNISEGLRILLSRRQCNKVSVQQLMVAFNIRF